MDSKRLSLQEFQELNNTVGCNWFKPDTIKFFKSKVTTWFKDGWFITSEVNPSKIKRYTIRKANFETGRVSTVGEFHSYNTEASALKALEKARQDASNT